ncbi:MAG: hypothetical protein WAR79_04990 [Melioribacteraceae bacterium]
MEYDFCLRIDFEKRSKNPSRVFTSMANYIECFKEIDDIMSKTIDSKISSVLLLEDIESGSLKSFFRNVLTSVDDNALKSGDWKKLVGGYLVKVKYKILEFLEDKNQIESREEIEGLQNEIHLLAEETNVRALPGYAKIPMENLLYGIRRISTSSRILTKKDKVEFITPYNVVKINKEFIYDSDLVEELLTRETISNISEMILKVKKPDYLGESMWDFKHGDRALQAKFTNIEWLKEFQSRKFDIRPGDSIRAKVETQIKYGFTDEIIATHYFISDVLEIIKGSNNILNEDLFN